MSTTKNIKDDNSYSDNMDGWYSLGLGMRGDNQFALYIMNTSGEIIEMIAIENGEATQHITYFEPHLPTELMLIDLQNIHPFISKFLTAGMLSSIRAMMRINPMSIIQEQFPIYEFMVFHNSPFSHKSYISIREAYYRSKDV